MRYALYCLVILALSTPLLANSVPISGASRLPPDQIEVIQSLGQAVLQAKKSLTPDPNVEDLKQSADALKAAVNGAVSISLPSNSAQLIVNRQTAANKANTQNTGSQDIKESAGFRSRLDQFHIKHAEIESNLLSRAKTKDKLQKQEAYPILLQLRQMSDELDQALIAPPKERQQRLAHLKHRLDTKTETVQHQALNDQHHGLTTIVRHYSNEQATSATPPPRQ